MGAVQLLAPGDTLDSTGSLKTIPPYNHSGKSYSARRVIQGSWDRERVFMAISRAQEVQTPLELDTSWLAVGHIDEFLQFLSVKSKRGWVMMVDGPRVGVDILRNASKNGHGGSLAVSRLRFPSEQDDQCVPKMTVNEKIKMPKLISLNEAAAQRTLPESIHPSLLILSTRHCGIALSFASSRTPKWNN